MGDRLARKFRLLVIGVLGTLAVLAWWSIRGGGGDDEERPLPAVVDGGGHRLVVDLTTSHETAFSVSFDCESGGEESVEEWGRALLEPGEPFELFDAAGDCWYAIFEARIHDPPVGAAPAWKVRVDDETWEEESRRLDEPLTGNQASFLQTGWDDATLEEVLEWRRDDG